jgi:hypothetical protein
MSKIYHFQLLRRQPLILLRKLDSCISASLQIEKKNRYKEMISVSLPKWHSMPDFSEAEKNQDEVRNEDQEPEELNTSHSFTLDFSPTFTFDFSRKIYLAVLYAYCNIYPMGSY